MASVVLATAGAAFGASIPVVGPFIGSAVGGAIGAQVGGAIDDAIFGVPTRSVEGPRLADLSVQVSSYGTFIPIIYGNMRIAGNIIWSRPISETSTQTTSSSGGGKGVGSGAVETTTTSYSYSVTLAIALCEGEIDGVVRAWADAELLDVSQGNYRVYHGSQDQLPDSIIESYEGAGATPAYRGLAYVVIEDFPLANYGNRIPNFTFEIKRSVRTPDYGELTTEEMIHSVTLIPGAGEFVYDTTVQMKVRGEPTGVGFATSEFKEPANQHASTTLSNVSVSLDQLAATCPNVEWVSIVVSWFGDDMNAGACAIRPGVEYADGATTQPDAWRVGSTTRGNAYVITSENGTPRYGGTPSDDSVLRLIDDCKARGYKVMLYPMFFMDVAQKPWRGRVTGTLQETADFFTKPGGMDAFVMHYANLAKNKVDAFVIGSELIGLTSVTDGAGNYPAVDALVGLAASVKSAMGASTLVTYAADWSEYHHADGGWYNLDPLWASPDIDMIGIDAYFPLTDAPQRDLGYDVQSVIDGWDSGEGYDFFYSDPARTVQSPLQPAYAWKNLAWFWQNTHVNPDGATTGWVPQSKKIWFTEYGFPSVDGATNQPNVFYDPASIESFFPRHSRGLVDFRAQRVGITATEARWQDSAMIERQFIWTWDARPYPYFPDLRYVWADGNVWATGHWVTGKLNISGLAAIVRELCIRAGIDATRINVSALTQQVDGFVIVTRSNARNALQQLMDTYFFDAVETNGQLVFVPRDGAPVTDIAQDTLIREHDGENHYITESRRVQERDLPSAVDISFIHRSRDYQTSAQRATRQSATSRTAVNMNVPLVLSAAEALMIADTQLYMRWIARTRYRFTLGMEHSALDVGDVVRIISEAAAITCRIVQIRQDKTRMQVDAVADDETIYAPYAPNTADDDADTTTQAIAPVSDTALTLLDIPALPSDRPDEASLRVAVSGQGTAWNGAVIYRSYDDQDYNRLLTTRQTSVMGTITQPPLPFYAGNIIDRRSVIDMRVLGQGELFSISDSALINGANACVVGDEVLQFRDATLLHNGKYRLSHLLRGRLGTEHHRQSHQSGEPFVLLDDTVTTTVMSPELIGATRYYKPVSAGATLGATDAQPLHYRAVSLLPYAPVHGRVTQVGSDMHIAWVRRDRLLGYWRDGDDIGLSEKDERYDVDIHVGGAFKRTITSHESAAVYSTAMQSDDNVVIGDGITITIYQRSNIVGRGHGLELYYVLA